MSITDTPSTATPRVNHAPTARTAARKLVAFVAHSRMLLLLMGRSRLSSYYREPTLRRSV